MMDIDAIKKEMERMDIDAIKKGKGVMDNDAIKVKEKSKDVS